MANAEIYDYLTTITPDYSTTEFGYDGTTEIQPQNIIYEEGGKNIIIHMADDDSEQRIGISTDTVFYVRMQWDNLNQTQVGALLDYYHNTTKASGSLNSFYWSHPTDGHTYVCRFTGPLVMFKHPGSLTGNARWGIQPIRLRVLGRKAD